MKKRILFQPPGISSYLKIRKGMIFHTLALLVALGILICGQETLNKKGIQVGMSTKERKM
jgi:hypothetical protein